jgi:hypothetical protein
MSIIIAGLSQDMMVCPRKVKVIDIFVVTFKIIKT